jgi:hypothetical protein
MINNFGHGTKSVSVSEGPGEQILRLAESGGLCRSPETGPRGAREFAEARAGGLTVRAHNERAPRNDTLEKLYLGEGGEAGDALADDEAMNVVSAFVGGDRLQVVHVTHNAVIIDDAIGAENVAGFARGF